MGNQNFLEAHNIVKKFVNHTALDDVSVNVKQGRIFGLLGPNGAGKTTLIRIINHITAPDSGEVFFDGRPMVAEDVYKIGYLPEERGLYKKMKVGEQAIYLARLKGLDKATATKRLRYWFEKFDISQWWNKKVEELSKGMQQKVQFITTVLHEPQLLILDEPFSGFDPVNAEMLKSEILALKEKGHTIIFSTHNMNSVEEICDDIALINRSHLVLEGCVDDVRRQFKSNLFYVEADSQKILPPVDGVEILSIEAEGDTTRYKLKKHQEMTNSELVSALAQKIEISTFKEFIPSMNEIFIKVVGEQNIQQPLKSSNYEQ
jgi:ABC-2 type transport system ATP-binding protein